MKKTVYYIFALSLLAPASAFASPMRPYVSAGAGISYASVDVDYDIYSLNVSKYSMSDVVFSGHVAAGANLNDKIRLEFEVSRYSEFSDKAPRNFNVVMGFYQTYPALDIDTYMLNLYADVYSLENSAAKVFVGAGVGAARVVLGGSTDYDTYGVQPIRKQSERKGTFMLESGVDYPLDDRTSLMVSMRYQYINMRDTFSKSFVGHMDMVTANAGVRVTF